MKLMRLDQLQSGEILGQSILGETGQVLLQSGVKLTSSYIRRLHQLGFTYVFIYDEQTSDIEIRETLSAEYQKSIFLKIKKSLDTLSNPRTAAKFIQSGELGETFSAIFNVIYQEVKANKVVIYHLNTMFSSDAFLYTHCMNVGLYTTAMGIAHGYSEVKVKELGIGAMLHDIGKLGLKRELLDKPGALTEEERKEIEQHCELGFELLIQQENISAVSAHCALQHHERFDGKGYPRHLRGEEIHEVGRILAVADVYDALTSNRAYRKAFLPHEAIEILYTETGTHFDPQFVKLFTKHINVYPPGMPIRLSNGLSGVVADVNQGQIQRPVARILEENGKLVTPYDFDLSKNLNVVISGCDILSISS